jgi:hypothetical protein
MSDKVLILHSYPPTPCLHGFEVGLRELGHEVVCAGPQYDYGGYEDRFKVLQPHVQYHDAGDRDETVMQLCQRLNFNPDWLLYLQPNKPWLPPGLDECPFPTVGFLTEEYKNYPLDRYLYPLFDAAPTAMLHAQERDQRASDLHRPCFNFALLGWIPQTVPDPDERPIDIAFVGHIGAQVTRARDQQLLNLWGWCRENGLKMQVQSGIFLDRVVNLYAHSKLVWTRSGQGPNNVTFRFSEAFRAGACVITPDHEEIGGLVEPLNLFSDFFGYSEPEQAIRALLEPDPGPLSDTWHEHGASGRAWLDRNTPAVQMQWFIDTVVDPLRSLKPDARAERYAKYEIPAGYEALRAMYYGAYGE